MRARPRYRMGCLPPPPVDAPIADQLGSVHGLTSATVAPRLVGHGPNEVGAPQLARLGAAAACADAELGPHGRHGVGDPCDQHR